MSENLRGVLSGSLKFSLQNDICSINPLPPSVICNNLCKEFGPRSAPTKCRAWSGSNLFDTQMVLLKI